MLLKLLVLLFLKRKYLSSKPKSDSQDIISIKAQLFQLSLEFSNRLPDKILDKTQLQRFLGSLNYVLDFCPNINRIAKPLHDRLKKNPVPWTDEHTKVIQQIKKHIVEIPCLHLADPNLPKAVEIDASDLGYGGILKQVQNGREVVIQYTSRHWNDIQ